MLPVNENLKDITQSRSILIHKDDKTLIQSIASSAGDLRFFEYTYKAPVKIRNKMSHRIPKKKKRK